MARPEIRTHPKFRRLQRILKLPPPYVLGLLEMMWHVGYDSANDELGESEDVECAAEWPGKSGEFTEAALVCGFLDKTGSEPPIYLIHNLKKHAPEYVKKRLARRIDKGLTPETADNGRHSADNGCRAANIKQVMDASLPPSLPRIPPLPSLPYPQDSSEAAERPSAEKPLLEFPVIKGKKSDDETWPFCESQRAELQSIFVGVDVLLEARKALLWIRSNPTKRKTPVGMPKFINGWMERATNKPGGNSSSPPPRPRTDPRTVQPIVHHGEV